jgi:UDP-galactose transporter B1
MTASNESLGHVSYPTAVLAKSSKLIPTMLVGYFIERKSFLREEVFSATLITIGIIVFNLCKIQQQKEKKRNLNGGNSGTSDVDENNDSTYGLFLLLFSLAMDGFLSSCQNKLKDCGKEIETSPSSSTTSSKLGDKVEDKKRRQVMYRRPTALETMLWINAYAIVFLLPLSIWSGQFSNGIKMLNLPNPTTSKTTTTSSSLSIQQTIVVLNLTAATGQIFIFFTIQLFSPLMTTTITTTRKFLTILLSVWKFGHKFTFAQWFSIFMVFSGLYLGIISKFVGGKSTRNGNKYEHKHDLKNCRKSRIRNKQKEKSFSRVKGE